jgi:hypothetical protein
VLRGVFIAADTAMPAAGTWAFPVSGLVLFASAVKIPPRSTDRRRRRA